MYVIIANYRSGSHDDDVDEEVVECVRLLKKKYTESIPVIEYSSDEIEDERIEKTYLDFISRIISQRLPINVNIIFISHNAEFQDIFMSGNIRKEEIFKLLSKINKNKSIQINSVRFYCCNFLKKAIEILKDFPDLANIPLYASDYVLIPNKLYKVKVIGSSNYEQYDDVLDFPIVPTIRRENIVFSSDCLDYDKDCEELSEQQKHIPDGGRLRVKRDDDGEWVSTILNKQNQVIREPMVLSQESLVVNYDRITCLIQSFRSKFKNIPTETEEPFLERVRL